MAQSNSLPAATGQSQPLDITTTECPPPSKSRKSSTASSSYSSASGSLQVTPTGTTPSPLLHEFYSGRSIFITGGTGFVGKVLIEKLLYTFADIGKLYILMRPKAGQLIRTRRQELIDSAVFDRVRAHCPEQFEKIIAIGGDIAYPGLGINPLEMQALAKDVSVIFHSAATIRFDEPLKYALKLNTLGTKRVIELAKKLKNLAAFVHVSTAYCTVNKINIEEKVYRETISPEKVLEMADFMDDATFNHQMKTIFYQGRPCSYHYTKSLAEHLIAEQVESGYIASYSGASRPDSADTSDVDGGESGSSGGGSEECYDDSGPNLETPAPASPLANWRPFPAAIIRPSIITCSWREPFPGWIDNYNGTTGYMVVSGKGVLRTIHVNPDYVTDMIPVDVVISACISAAWYVAACRPKGSPPAAMSGGRRCSSGSSSSGLSSAAASDAETAQERNEPFVVNCVSGSTNAITWAQLRELTTPILMKYPSAELFRVPGVRYHRYELLHQLNLLLEHSIPAAVTDFVFRFLGHTPVMSTVYQKVHRTINALEHFTMNEWTYCSDNLLLLDRAIQVNYIKAGSSQFGFQKRSTQEVTPTTTTELEEEDTPAFSYYRVSDQRMRGGARNGSRVETPFPMDLAQLNWEEYFTDYVLGVRKYLLKEDPRTIPEARRTLLMLQTVTLISKLAIGGTIAYQLLHRRSLTRQTIDLLRALLLKGSSPASSSTKRQ